MVADLKFLKYSQAAFTANNFLTKFHMIILNRPPTKW